ncbi:MAG: nucleotidyltransferase domain-containing protein [Calditrichota bacterium]
MPKTLKTPSGFDSENLSILCRKWKIKELALFGSALREDFGPDSDVDLVVKFHPDAHWSLWDFYDLQNELESIFKREVDLVEIEGVTNPLRRKNILNSMKVVYAA